MADYPRPVNGTLLQTPLRDTRRDSGRAITVLCPRHAGPPAYVAAVRAIINDLPAGGAEGHVDGARLGPIDTQPSHDEQLRLDQLQRGNRLQQRRRAEIGRVDQREGPGLPAPLAQRRTARRILLDEDGPVLAEGHPMINRAATDQRRRSR